MPRESDPYSYANRDDGSYLGFIFKILAAIGLFVAAIGYGFHLFVSLAISRAMTAGTAPTPLPLKHLLLLGAIVIADVLLIASAFKKKRPNLEGCVRPERSGAVNTTIVEQARGEPATKPQSAKDRSAGSRQD